MTGNPRQLMVTALRPAYALYLRAVFSRVGCRGRSTAKRCGSIQASGVTCHVRTSLDVLADAGVVVGESDEEAWTCTLRELLDDTARLGHLSRRGRQMAVERFAWHVIGREHVEFFDEIVDLRRQN